MTGRASLFEDDTAFGIAGRREQAAQTYLRAEFNAESRSLRGGTTSRVLAQQGT
jgi:hypothetical protein